MNSDKLPAVLYTRTPGQSSISMERALKQIIKLLEDVSPDNDKHGDELEASLADARMMLNQICRD